MPISLITQTLPAQNLVSKESRQIRTESVADREDGQATGVFESVSPDPSGSDENFQRVIASLESARLDLPPLTVPDNLSRSEQNALQVYSAVATDADPFTSQGAELVVGVDVFV